MKKFALIIDGIGTDDVRSYQTKKGKTYRLGTNIEYTPENPLASITNDCLISTYNFPHLFDGYFINWKDYKYDLPDLDLDLIFVVRERSLARTDGFWDGWCEVSNLRQKYPKAKIVGFIKEVWVGPPYDYEHPKHIARINFLNECDAVVHNRPSLKEFKHIKDKVNKPFNFIGQPHNINYFYDMFAKDKELAIWVYTPNRGESKGDTYRFASYISEKYNLPLKAKDPSSNFYIPLKEFIEQWSSCLFHFNLDPIDYFPGKQAVHCASVGTINVGGLNDNHHLLFPNTATNDWDMLESEIVKCIEDETYRNKTIQYAWDKVNDIFGFESVKNQINNINYE